jgi:hypothetical protein
MKQYRHYERLIKIQDILSRELEYFPDNRCCESSRIVGWTLGLEEVAGSYRNGFHAWNYDKLEEKWIDIAFRQFHPASPRIVIVPKGHRLYKVNQDDTMMQKELAIDKIDEILPLFEHLATT